MTCPECSVRTEPPDVSGVVSGVAPVVSGVSVDSVRSEVRAQLRTDKTDCRSVCPESLPLEELRRSDPFAAEAAPRQADPDNRWPLGHSAIPVDVVRDASPWRGRCRICRRHVTRVRITYDAPMDGPGERWRRCSFHSWRHEPARAGAEP